jgi:hypothetical protein
MRSLLILIFALICIEGLSQVLPGMTRGEVISLMSDSFGDFIPVQPPNHDKLDFIKYEHVSGDLTLLVFISEKGICTFTRLMADLHYKDELTGTYNRIYEPAGEKTWLARERGKLFVITMEEKDWMIRIMVREQE